MYIISNNSIQQYSGLIFWVSFIAPFFPASSVPTTSRFPGHQLIEPTSFFHSCGVMICVILMGVLISAACHRCHRSTAFLPLEARHRTEFRNAPEDAAFEPIPLLHTLIQNRPHAAEYSSVLAKFHAVGLVHRQFDPEVFECFLPSGDLLRRCFTYFHKIGLFFVATSE